MSRAFYPFVEENQEEAEVKASYAARIAVYDDAASAPRVVVIDPTDVRSYLEEITSEVSRLSREQGGHIPFMVIREVVENLIHAYFREPAISILDGGDTIRFADQGPGIKEKDRALEYGTTSATEEMKRYIRGVGSGLPYAQQYLHDHGGTLDIQDNISGGTIVTISMERPEVVQAAAPVAAAVPMAKPAVELSARGEKVLAYLAVHESVGPKDLVEAYGGSQPTWSRELKALEEKGVVSKRGGQKRYLTSLGQMLLP
ncbi:MAG: ATP-binding protein [Atopobiaceae bacterium]|nr:ATP-binding protein [Atopobiaceae bacterium]